MLLFLSIIATVALIIFLVQWLLLIRKRCRILSLLPGPKNNHFVLGNIPILIGRSELCNICHSSIFQSMVGLSVLYREKGLFRVWIAYDPYVVLFSADTIEPVINNPNALNKSRDYDLLHCWLGTGLLTSTGKKWKERRRLITPTFRYSILNDFIPIFDSHSKLLAKQLKKFDGSDGINIIPIVTLFTLDVICETAMGVKLGSIHETTCEYAEAITNFGDIFIKRVMKPWLQNDFIFSQTSDGHKLKKSLQILHRLTKKVIKRRKQELLKNNNVEDVGEYNTELIEVESKRRQAFLDLLLEKQQMDNCLSDEDICEEVHTFMFEGHDTTSMGISWALYHLGCNPQIQEKVYEELRSILGDDKERAISSDDLREMKYLERVIKECQRISPSVPVASRFSTEDINIKGYTIPRGSTFVFFIYALHHDPKVFPNPDVFDPDRFLPENSLGRHPYAYIPFLVGSRNCIGQKFAMMEMKISICNIIRNYVIESIDPPDKIIRSALMILRAKSGLKMKFKRRD